MFFAIVMLVVAMTANAQRIASMCMENGHSVIYLENGMKLDARAIPNAHRLHVGETIEYGQARIASDDYYREAIKYQVPVNTGMYGMYGVAVPVGIYGGTGSSISIGNEHWGFSTSSSNYGGYKTSSTGIRIGGFHIGTSKAGFTKPTAERSNSNTKNSVATSASTRSTTYSNVKEVNINDLMRYCK